jgi:very-short-patch-repair endonuclease
VEVDGSQYSTDSGLASDAERTKFLEAAGLHVLRVNNREVLTELGAVLNEIWTAVRGYNPSP